MRFSGINCTQGRNIVASSGYNHVRDIACDGMTYTYRAHRFNHNYVVSVNSRRGAISSATQFWWMSIEREAQSASLAL